MATIKTAISLEEPLFREVESLVRELRMSRSQFFALAAREYIEQARNRDLLNRINRAYSEGPTAAEKALNEKRKTYHHRMIQGEW
jgi:metal-responsive CopG/Arc/MetJ family transcriptional regulator